MVWSPACTVTYTILYDTHQHAWYTDDRVNSITGMLIPYFHMYECAATKERGVDGTHCV